MQADHLATLERVEHAAQAVVDRWETPLWKDVPHTANFIHALRDTLPDLRTLIQQAAQEGAAGVPAKPIDLNIIRWWPDGFAQRLEHVWRDLVGFIPDYKLYDLQRTLAEFGFTMVVYEGAAPSSATPIAAQGDALDAARYRWLRGNAYIELQCDSPRVAGWSPESLDLKVDAAMRKGD